jgi:hypothetical protein
MIEMKMRIDDHRDIGRSQPAFGKWLLNGGASFDTIDVVKSGISLVSDTGVDQDVSTLGLDQKYAELKSYLVPVVGRMVLFPKRLGHNAEHGTTIEFQLTICQRKDLKETKLHGFIIPRMP